MSVSQCHGSAWPRVSLLLWPCPFSLGMENRPLRQARPQELARTAWPSGDSLSIGRVSLPWLSDLSTMTLQGIGQVDWSHPICPCLTPWKRAVFRVYTWENMNLKPMESPSLFTDNVGWDSLNLNRLYSPHGEVAND